MISKIKRLIKKFLFSYRCDEKSYIEYLRKGGARIGDRVCIFDPRNTIIDATRPYMINIGNDVQITSGVTILTHGYDWSVLKGIYGEVLGSAGEVVIGNNCFIGMHTTILKGVHIGDNCIIGANSLVNKDIPSGWVAAGNPAKPIMKIEDYYIKRRAQQLSEAKEIYRCYLERFGVEPSEDIFFEHFWLFKRRTELLPKNFEKRMKTLGNYDLSFELYSKSSPEFDGFESLLSYLRSVK